MLGSITILLLFQLAGEGLVLAFKLPVPGPVVGMLLLLVALLMRGAVPPPLRETSNGLLEHLSLLFVPAGVGVMVHLPRIGQEWLPMVVALVASTILTVAVTAVTLNVLIRINGRDSRSGDTDEFKNH